MCICNRFYKVESNPLYYPFTSPAASTAVKKAAKTVEIGLRLHDIRRHAATYASRSGTSIEIVSEVVLRHANPATTQRDLGKISDIGAMRRIETLLG